MTSDPFWYRCGRCGVPLDAPAAECGRGAACRTDFDRIRALATRAGAAVRTAARRLGLIH